MRKNEKAWWKAIVLLREIELEKLSVLTRRAWCADDCVRGSDQSLSWFCWIAMSTLPNNVTTTHWKEKNRASIYILVLSFSSATKTGICHTRHRCLPCSVQPKDPWEMYHYYSLLSQGSTVTEIFSGVVIFSENNAKLIFLLSNFHIDFVNVGTYCVFALICIFVCKQK